MAFAMLAVTLTGCAGKPTPGTEINKPDAPSVPAVTATQEIRVGTSNVYFTAPASYQKGPMSIEDTDEGQVAYYKSNEDLLDFDLYHWAKATDETIESAVAEETDSDAQPAKYNNIDFLWYDDVEESDGQSYATKTYITEDSDYFVEFVFWADGESADKKIDDIMNTVTIKKDNGKTGEGIIRIGTSDLYLSSDKGYEKSEMTREDTDLCQVAYYKSANSLVDFDLYYWAKGDGETLESTAAAEGEEFKAEIKDRVINGIDTKYYNAKAEESEDGSFPTLTYIIDDGDYLAEVVFWLDGETAQADAEAIISTLTR